MASAVQTRRSTPAPGVRRVLDAAVLGGFALATALVAAASSWQAVLHISEQRLGAYASMLYDRATELDAEVRTTLDTFNRQPARLCTTREAEQLRERVYRAYFVKDIGRVRGGRMFCTASLLDLAPPVAVPPAQLTTVEGWDVASMELQLLASGSRAPVIGFGQTRVILDPLAFHLLPSTDMGFVVGYLDADATRLLPLYGNATRLDVATLRAGRPVDRDGVLAYPLCTAAGTFCVASAQPKTAVLADHWLLLLVCTVLGALAGAAAGLALLLSHRRRHSLEGRLQQAIARNALEVEYQPVVRLADGAIVGAEALVRWRDDDGRMVPPSRFVPIAEENGSVQQITVQVLRRVATEFGDLLREPGTFRISINISAADLDSSHFHDAMASTLETTGIAPERIGIELTEHSTTERAVAVSGTRRLRELGHRVYIDDFGTGYSSLAYLAELDVHALKIDRSFTSTIGTDAVKVSLVPQIIELARTLGLQVVIEGVETEAQRDYLRSVDFPLYAQGWLFGRPMTAARFRDALDADAAGKLSDRS
ncbi:MULTISPECIES: EAL domain-containing protein [Luteimonas]|uniref:EAL domain-containing protein n=1 Tax=Luteimonas TaxID=83614 RepID=UPI0013044E98|nr:MULTISPECIES: EAL domain-containing protein [Luteimonas]